MNGCSVKANSQVGNICIYPMTEKDKATKYSTWGLKNICALLENLARGLGERLLLLLLLLFLYLKLTEKYNKKIYIKN